MSKVSYYVTNGPVMTVRSAVISFKYYKCLKKLH